MLPLRELTVATDSLYLDPNNPRFADLHDKQQPVPITRVTEQGVQENALKRILDDHFEVAQLKDSIRTIGFLPVDQLVVTPLPEPGKYMVVEGNRRLGAIRSLRQDHTNGEAELAPQVMETLVRARVQLIDEPDEQKRERLGRVIQGVRHVSGIRPWGPYQQAQVVAMMLDEGREQSEVCEVLGLPKRRINTLRRCYHALEQMRQDDDHGGRAKPALFSSFDEIFKLKKFRDWLEWDDERDLALNENNRKLLYSWLVGTEDENGAKVLPKLSDHKEVRKLSQLMDDPVSFARFCESPTLAIDDALQGAVSKKSSLDWRAHIHNLISILGQIPAVDLEAATEQDEALLSEAQRICERHIRFLKSA